MSNSFLNALLCLKSVINLLCCFQKVNKTLPQQEEQSRTSIIKITNEIINRRESHVHNKSDEQNNIKLESRTTHTFANEQNNISLNNIENEKPMPNMNALKQTMSQRLKSLTDSLKSKKRSEPLSNDANSPLTNKELEHTNEQDKGKRLKTVTNSVGSKTKSSKAVITTKVASMAQNLKNKKR